MPDRELLAIITLPRFEIMRGLYTQRIKPSEAPFGSSSRRDVLHVEATSAAGADKPPILQVIESLLDGIFVHIARGGSFPMTKANCPIVETVKPTDHLHQ